VLNKDCNQVGESIAVGLLHTRESNAGACQWPGTVIASQIWFHRALCSDYRTIRCCFWIPRGISRHHAGCCPRWPSQTEMRVLKRMEGCNNQTRSFPCQWKSKMHSHISVVYVAASICWHEVPSPMLDLFCGKVLATRIADIFTVVHWVRLSSIIVNAFGSSFFQRTLYVVIQDGRMKLLHKSIPSHNDSASKSIPRHSRPA